MGVDTGSALEKGQAPVQEAVADLVVESIGAVAVPVSLLQNVRLHLNQIIRTMRAKHIFRATSFSPRLFRRMERSTFRRSFKVSAMVWMMKPRKFWRDGN